MVEIKYEQAKAIVDLGNKIEPLLTLDDVMIGIVTDGVPIVNGIEYILRKIKEKDCPVSEYICISSKRNFIDVPKINFIKSKYRKRIYVDWRTVTGSLGQMLKTYDSDCLYAVLSDPNRKADIRVKEEDIPKINLPDNPAECLETIGVWFDLKRLESGGKIDYHSIQTNTTSAFYDKLFRLVEEIYTK